MYINRNRFIFNCIYSLIFVIFFLFIIINFNWKLAASLSILLLIISILYLKYSYDMNIISYSTIFLLCMWLFYCGQIMNYAFEFKGTNYLFFINYGTEQSCYAAFIFYFISQFLLTLYIGKSYIKEKQIHDNSIIMFRNLPLVLFIIGIIPRLYYDLSFLKYGLKYGYHGTAIYIPQFINTLAYFADIGILLEIVQLKKNKEATLLLIISLVYKGIMMMSGDRAEAFCFVIIEIYIYFFIDKAIKLKKMILYIVIGYVSVSFIMSIGNLRGTAFQSIPIFISTFLKNLRGGFICDMFGEFGSTFTTLVKTINDTPCQVHYGYGLSYIAGIISIIPSLVSEIPLLSNMTTYITQYHNVSSFGGAFLGELFYNFSWFGLFAIPIIGKCIGRVSASFDKLRLHTMINDRAIISLVVSVPLLLFIRGYFSDMTQKIVWVLLFIYFIVSLKDNKKI